MSFVSTRRSEQRRALIAASSDDGARWIEALESSRQSEPSKRGELFDRGFELLERTTVDRNTAEAFRSAIATSAFRFFGTARQDVYRELTDDFRRFVRVDELMWLAADKWPGLLPNRAQLAAEDERLQGDKLGREILQGLFVGQVLSDSRAGRHLLESMLLPTEEATSRLDGFVRTGRADLGTVKVEIRDDAAWVVFECPRYLNAEDMETVRAFETAVDLVLLHPEAKLGILRGGRVSHPKYEGRRIFSSGINLTKLYHGKIPFLFYLVRDLGVVHKIFRGLGDGALQEVDTTLEKPWLAVVEGFAIGGGCQLLLVVDSVIAESGAYFNLPARKEGIIPGAANLRLPRFLGERLAREAILFGKSFPVESPEAAGLIGEVHPSHTLDEAIRCRIHDASASGLVSAAGNRKALRHASESVDRFRRYMATYAVEQAFCHFSSDLIRNLETHWRARERKLED